MMKNAIMNEPLPNNSNKKSKRKKVRIWDTINIDPDTGAVYIQPVTITDPTFISNFCYPKITILHRINNPEERIYLFKCEIDGKTEELLLSENKLYRPSYFLNKLLFIGGEFIVPKYKQKEYAENLLISLIDSHTDDLYIPDLKGWYHDINGDIRFWDNEYTWETLCKIANE